MCGRETGAGKGAVDLSQGPRHTRAEGGGPGPPAPAQLAQNSGKGHILQLEAGHLKPQVTRLGPAAESPQPLRLFHFTPGCAICPLGMESTLEAAPPSCLRHQHPLAPGSWPLPGLWDKLPGLPQGHTQL